jgi:hypothetical protein
MSYDNCPFKDNGTCSKTECKLWCPIEGACVQVCQVIEQRRTIEALSAELAVLAEAKDYIVKYLPAITELLEKIASK